MKKILLFSILAVIGLNGCQLDREPETVLTDTNFWKSETDFRGACNRLYIDLPGFGHDYRSDEIIGTSQNGISSGNRTVPGTSSDWTDPYNRIGVANNIIKKISASSQSEAIKNRWLAEAYFFRAYNYFDLVKKYGDVPLILKAFETTEDPDIKMPRTPREQVIQQCYEDLEFAYQWLPDIDDVSSVTDWGRVSKSAALGMLTRVGLYEGTFAKHHGLTSDYKAHLKKSIDAAEALIKTGKHALNPDFYRMFLFDGEGRQNKENVFVKIYGPNDAGIIVHNNSRTLENAASVTRQTIDQFLYKDGLPRKLSSMAIIPDTSFDDVFANRDPRLGMTIFKLHEDAYKGEYIPFTNQHGNGYPIKKGFMLDQWQLNSRETVDKMIIRYAEILLSYAEALYEYNGSITDAQLDMTVNVVRERSGMTVRLTNDFVSSHGLNMLDEIRRERLVEFIDEGLHYDDIIRWKTAEKVLPTDMLGIKYVSTETSADKKTIGGRLTTDGGMFQEKKVYDQADIYVIESGDTRSFNPDRDYYYPIPSYEIGTSDGSLIQNPNW